MLGCNEGDFLNTEKLGEKSENILLPSVLKTEVYSDIISDMQVYGNGTQFLYPRSDIHDSIGERLEGMGLVIYFCRCIIIYKETI